MRREGFITFPKTENFIHRFLKSHEDIKSVNARLDALQAWKQMLVPWFQLQSFTTYHDKTLELWRTAVTLATSQPVRGERWLGPISNMRSHIVHSNNDPITERCNPNYSPTRRLYISPPKHWAINLKDQENHNWRHYVPACRKTDRPNVQPTNQPTNLPTNQHICRQFCQQYADRLCQQAPSLMEMEGSLPLSKGLQLNPTAGLF